MSNFMPPSYVPPPGPILPPGAVPPPGPVISGPMPTSMLPPGSVMPPGPIIPPGPMIQSESLKRPAPENFQPPRAFPAAKVAKVEPPTSVTISRAPVRKHAEPAKQEKEEVKYEYGYAKGYGVEQIDTSGPLPAYPAAAPIPAKVGTSYQEAMRAAAPHAPVEYVFQHNAPKKVAQAAAPAKPAGPPKFFREAAGVTWEDPTMADWDPNDFRIFVGDLGNEVNDESLARAFRHYPSFQKAKVVREKKTNKSRGFGFVSFSNGLDFGKALREMNGTYIGNRPCKLRKSTWKDREGEEPVKTKKKR
eukprot:TRINITY_DN27430_c0_g1_i1.p1 TRINITY_DN27430_c0_g1~~TRINITY_DN27430_c0_g1_i1.p1  ORF type:complete len:304 (+),score=35.14 TRINITY_DN27430_c0_g1_i1:38-949(+)